MTFDPIFGEDNEIIGYLDDIGQEWTQAQVEEYWEITGNRPQRGRKFLEKVLRFTACRIAFCPWVLLKCRYNERETMKKELLALLEDLIAQNQKELDIWTDIGVTGQMEYYSGKVQAYHIVQGYVQNVRG